MLGLDEKMWTVMDGLIKKGEIEEFGFFPMETRDT
jgi:hypothetical protein